MGKKVGKPTPYPTKWITLNAARTLVIETVFGPKLAERLIVEALRDGIVQWRGWRPDDSDFKPGDPALWQAEHFRYPAHCDGIVTGDTTLRPGIDKPQLTVNFPQNHVRRYAPVVFTVYRIEVPEADIIALLAKHGFGPQQQAKSPHKEPANDWALDRIRTVLPLLPAVLSDGRELADLTNKEVIACKEFNDEYVVKRRWPPPSEDSMGRCRKRRRRKTTK